MKSSLCMFLHLPLFFRAYPNELSTKTNLHLQTHQIRTKFAIGAIFKSAISLLLTFKFPKFREKNTSSITDRIAHLHWTQELELIFLRKC